MVREPKKLGKNRNDYKKSNRALVLSMIGTETDISRAELARRTGLTPMTITNIVGDLIDGNLVEEHETNLTDGVGRRPIGLMISPKAPRVVGLSVLRGGCEAVLCDLNLNILKRTQSAFENPCKEKLIHMICRMMDSLMKGEENVLAIGVSSIGPIDINAGMILHPFYFYDIENVEIVKLLSERYRLPVFFDNENQSAVIAEKLYGWGRGCENMLFIGVDVGVGCGAVVNGRQLRTSDGLNPEIGHVSIDCNGKPCVCGGRGCVELYINSSVILEKCKAVSGTDATYAEFCERSDEEGLHDIFRELIERLSYAAVSTVNLMNPELIVLGQNCVLWPDWCIELFRKEVNEHKFSSRKNIAVEKAFFRGDEIVLGAACNCISEVFRGRLLFDEPSDPQNEEEEA